MTNPTPEAATFTSMTLHRLPLALLAAASLTLTAPLRAQATDPDAGLRELLRDALYTEEVTRDPEAAAKQYEELIARHEEQRPFAANALFRLAEIRHRQDRKEEAAALYRRLLSVFPDAELQAKLSRERLAGLGEVAPAAENSPPDEESKELQRLQQIAEASPDLLRKPEILVKTVMNGWVRPTAFLLERVSSPSLDASALEMAASLGHLAIVKMVLARGLDPKGEGAAVAILEAAEAGNLEIVKTLLAAGVSPDGKLKDSRSTPLVVAARKGNLELARLLIEKGADVNLMPLRCFPQLRKGEYYIGGPLHEAIGFDQPEIIDLLLANKADVNLLEPRGKLTPLWLAAWKGKPDLIKRLLDLGADPDTESVKQFQNNGFEGYPGQSTPLERAIIAGSVESVKLLLEAKDARKTPLESTLLFDAVISHRTDQTLDIAKLLLDHGADPNPTLPPFNSLLEEASKGFNSTIGNLIDFDKVWPVVELLLERGSKVDPEWEESGFASANQKMRVGLLRSISYPKWATEKSIRIVDLQQYSQAWPPAVPTTPDAGPPLLEQWLLEEEERDLGNLYKNFAEFALFRKTDAGIVEVTVFLLDAAEAFPQLQWGDILEIRNPYGNNSSARWDDKARKAMSQRVKVTPKPPEPGRPMPVPVEPPAQRDPRLRMLPPPSPSR